MKLGVEVFLEKHITKYEGKRIGLLTNLTGVNQQLKSTIDLFYHHKNIQLTTLFSPEHGLRGEVKEGEWIDSAIDTYTQLPVYSLYNKEKRPTPNMFKEVDVVFCDLQDIGSRYYTFIYTLAHMMKICRDLDIQVVVLDRPNPINGVDVEGNCVKEGFTSFVGEFPIPIRHGLTIGEIAILFNNEFHIHCHLEVIRMEGWSRTDYFTDTDLLWVSPTPNTTGQEMCLLYPGTCLIEGTNLSEGRGTTKPFEVIGAPFINGRQLAEEMNQLNLDGVLFRPTVFKPYISKHAHTVCEGVYLHITNREQLQPVKVGIKLLEVIFKRYPKQAQFIRSADFNNRYFIDLLAGTDELRKQLLLQNVEPFLQQMKYEAKAFHKVRDAYLLYH